MDNKRRTFLKGAGAVAASMLMPMSFSMRSANASGVPGNKKLIVLNMRGGNDGLNLAIPTEASQQALYQGYRPNIAIPTADILSMGQDVNGIDLGEDASGMTFGLHPSMAALQPNFDKLAVFPATHSALGAFAHSRSHFYQQDLFGAGTSGGDPFATDDKGWVGRYYDNRYPGIAPGIIGQDFTAARHGTFNGSTFLLQMASPNNVNLGTASTAVSDAIWDDIKDISTADPSSYAGRFGDKQHVFFDEVLGRLGDVEFDRVTNATYPGGVGTKFRYAAAMLLAIPELEVLHIEIGGFDTHTNQGLGAEAINGTARQPRILKNWADAIAALYDDLTVADPTLRANTVVTVQTEFGRTIKENGDMGTDHGNASCWMAFGDAVKGGVYGSYPGIEEANLNNNNWLKPTIDYRDIFSEVLGSHLGYTDPNSPFPGYTGAPNPYGFII